LTKQGAGIYFDPMTRIAQKQTERRTLDAILSALDLRPDQEPTADEAPDFTMCVARRLIVSFRQPAPFRHS
jgi:hypothetical protein